MMASKVRAVSTTIWGSVYECASSSLQGDNGVSNVGYFVFELAVHFWGCSAGCCLRLCSREESLKKQCKAASRQTASRAWYRHGLCCKFKAWDGYTLKSQQTS
jgi:hypothetical protein